MVDECGCSNTHTLSLTHQIPSNSLLSLSLPPPLLWRLLPLKKTLWMKSAGVLPFKPEVNSLVYYFCEGHAEHYGKSDDFDSSSIKPEHVAILCKIESISYLADAKSEEMVAEIHLISVAEPVPVLVPFELAKKHDDDFFTRTLWKTHIDQRLHLPTFTNGVFPSRYQSVTLVDVAKKDFAMKFTPAKSKPGFYLTQGWKVMSEEKGFVVGDILYFKKLEHGISFSIQRKENLAVLRFTKSEDSRVTKVERAFRRAKKGKPFKVIFFPNWVNFLVDPGFLRQSGKHNKIDKRVRKLNKKQEGTLMMAPVGSQEFAWKNWKVRWDGDGSAINVNSFDIEPV